MNSCLKVEGGLLTNSINIAFNVSNWIHKNQLFFFCDCNMLDIMLTLHVDKSQGKKNLLKQ